jgi:hypothetical protein
MSPLDLGQQKSDALREVPHLSPVFETRSPSPTASRKPESSAAFASPPPQRESAESGRMLKAGAENTVRKPSPLANGKMGVPNGHTRGAKSEGGGVGAWQQIQKGRRRGQQEGREKVGFGEAEIPPKFDADRKGG